MLRAYVYLGLAICVEIASTSLLKSTESFTKPLPSAACLLGYGFSFYMLSLTVETLSVGTSYALWSGIGTATVAAIGVLFLGESLDAAKITGLALIIAGVVALNLSSA